MNRWLRLVPPWYVALVALLGAQRLRELQLSSAHESATGGERAAQRTYSLMVAAHVGLFTAPIVEAAWRGTRRPRWPWIIVLAAATALRVWCIRTLGRSWNVHAAVPADLEPVVTGPYAWVRHPNYVAVILEFAALPLAGGAWVSALALSALNAAVLAVRIPAEERLLERSDAYRQAFGDRPRFLPFLF